MVEYLAAAGHRRIARVTGPPRLWHTKIRTDAFRAAARAAGVHAILREGDYTGGNGAAATRELLHGSEPPTAILYDNDLMAISGLGAAQQLGVPVPAEWSIVAWDDSAFCEAVHPSLSALTRDVAGYGGRAARALVRAAAGAEACNEEEPVAMLTVRGSTGPPPWLPAQPPQPQRPSPSSPAHLHRRYRPDGPPPRALNGSGAADVVRTGTPVGAESSGGNGDQPGHGAKII